MADINPQEFIEPPPRGYVPPAPLQPDNALWLHDNLPPQVGGWWNELWGKVKPSAASYLHDVVSGKIAAGGVLGQNYYDPNRTFAENALDPRAVDQAMNIALGVGPGAIRGFHGTPHTFPAEEGAPYGRFKDEAVGTGEGAQAYGWGHYAAGNPKVATSYQRQQDIGILWNGKPIHPDEFEEYPAQFHALSAYHAASGDVDRAVAALRHDAEGGFSKGMTDADIRDRLAIFGDDSSPASVAAERAKLDAQDREMAQEIHGNIAWLQSNHRQLKMPDGGHLLEIHIKPDEHELLDWDARIGDHSRDIVDKLDAANLLPNYNPMQMKGEDLYSHIVGEQMPGVVDAGFMGRDAIDEAKRLASKALHNAGVPGIKYFDAGSRRVQEGTRNYVIFDPSNLTITARNGQRLTPVDYDPFK